MLQILLYFGLNFLGFLVFYQIWKRLDKPEPYDYTTIPGLKCEDLKGTVKEIVIPPGQLTYDRSKKEGNMEEIRKCKNYRKFLSWLNLDYGPLASFYWGARYAIVISELKLLNDLKKYSEKRFKISPFAIGSILLGDPYFWDEGNFKTIDYIYPDPGIQTMLEEDFQNCIFMEYPNSRTLLAIYRSVISKTTSKKDFSKLTQLELWSRPLIVVFNEEIDVDAHPLPAHIPIIINMELILENENLENHEVESFMKKYFSWLFTVVNE